MKTEVVQTLTSTFEAHAQQTEDGVEYCVPLRRDDE
jgi:hypothetical protein